MKKSAFTLIEIVVSLGILALGILAIFSLIPAGVQQTKKGHDQSKAIILAQSKMEEIISIAAEDWDNFNTYNHYQFPSTGNTDPRYMGPNTPEERQIWGWECTNPAEPDPAKLTWVPKLGYQWEWHFISASTPPALPTPPPGNLALITLTVSWPQDWSEVTDAAGEQGAITNIQDYGTGGYVLTNSIQFVRLISYVSKGL